MRTAFLCFVFLLMPTIQLPGEEWPLQGMKEFSVKGGYSVRHVTGSDEDVDGYHLLPHIGYILTDKHGSKWLRGSLEFLFEPTLILLEHSDSATLGGFSLLGRWLLGGREQFHPYVETGAGILFGAPGLRTSDCATNFILQGGGRITCSSIPSLWDDSWLQNSSHIKQ